MIVESYSGFYEYDPMIVEPYSGFYECDPTTVEPYSGFCESNFVKILRFLWFMDL
jgi:hypothetical protein